MKKIMEHLKRRMKENRPSMLVTVVQRTGSSPGREGAVMLVGENGYITGTIGGGMLEYQCIALAMEDLKKNQGILRQYRLTKEDAAGLGMVCGGDVDVLFSIVLPTDENIRTIDEVLSCLNTHQQGWLLLAMDGSGIGFSVLEEKTNLKTTDVYRKNLGNTSIVYIFGGGHLAQELVPLLSHLGFRCVVTDDREEFAKKERFPQAEAVYTCDFDALEGKFEVQEEDYIIAMTRGHIGDMAVQRFAMRTQAHYIGVVGSRKKIAAVNEQLQKEGFTKEDLGRIITPIGLDIRSDTPAEIAVSIAAQLIERRALDRERKGV